MEYQISWKLNHHDKNKNLPFTRNALFQNSNHYEKINFLLRMPYVNSNFFWAKCGYWYNNSCCECQIGCIEHDARHACSPDDHCTTNNDFKSRSRFTRL